MKINIIFYNAVEIISITYGIHDATKPPSKPLSNKKAKGKHRCFRQFQRHYQWKWYAVWFFLEPKYYPEVIKFLSSVFNDTSEMLQVWLKYCR